MDVLAQREYGHGGDLEPEVCWQAAYSRDARFDGRFFAAAVTTRVYCRSICPVPFAKPDNILWFASAAAAEAAGFHPCRRCRSAASPGTPAWGGTSAVVSRALRLIAGGSLDSGSVEELAQRVGLGSRHLRRLFVEHLGASPVRIAITRRVHFARNLIEETDLPITQVAASAGFRSIRQFNHAMLTTTGESPTELRKMRGASFPSHLRDRRAGKADLPNAQLNEIPPQPGLLVRLGYRPPFNWAGLLAFLSRRVIAGVESVHDGAYCRTIEIEGVAGALEVRDAASERQLLVKIELPRYECLMQVAERVRRIFDLDADPFQIARQLSRDAMLEPALAANPGLRVPGIWDGLEAAVRAILGETLTDQTPRIELTRLVQAFGKPVKTSSPKLTHLFPRAEDLMDADLGAARIREKRAAMIRTLARAVANGDLTFDAPINLQDAITRVRVVPGMTRQMAVYVAMRAFGEPDAFPIPTPKLQPIAECWRPWRAYAAMHLCDQGLLS